MLGGAAWDESFAVLVAELVLLYAAASRLPMRQGVGCGVLLIASNVTCALLLFEDDVVLDVVFVIIVLSASLLAGVATGAQRSEASEVRRIAKELVADSDRRASAAVAEERRRIANELHDIVAHGISLIAVQAAAGRRVLSADAQPAAAATLETIEHAAQDALDEMRRLLGLLRADGSVDLRPLPGVRDLNEVAAAAAAAGVAVDLRVIGDTAALPPGADLAIYRIVQEAVTNIVKHGSPPATVTVRSCNDEITIDAVNAINATITAIRSSQHGLIGIRERAEIYGGTMTAGTTCDGRFRLHVEFPIHLAAR
jgi:signal transduction histidine kinase